MIRATTGARPEEVSQGARHTLFVEGADQNGLDPQVLHGLLRDLPVKIGTLGSSFHVQSAAQALHAEHPFYYFLVDRDHQDDAAVERSWRNFPDPKRSNLLIWRRRELESYFLIPEYLAASGYLTSSPQQLRLFLVKKCSRRIYLDVANMVIAQVRERLKVNWIKQFSSPEGFRDAEGALRKLLAKKEFASKRRSVSQCVNHANLEKRFRTILTRWLGDGQRPVFGKGRWLEMVRAKSVLPELVQRHFRVKDLQGRYLQGKDRLVEVVKDLLHKPLSEQPEDFQCLHALMEGQVRET